ncbi:hypothetical protein [Blastococcus sp. URHD0036]|uniref:hypothetical protein n=1 Tax=Blastococcus sp. URHD0036 TaxID=1380356 RepID=UPI000691AC9D|nr:hypothetical protein [Blastococcus sp. URHD0036]
MTAVPPPVWPQAAPSRRWGAGRVVALVFAILLLLPGVGLVLGGGLLLWADGPGRDDDGYLTTPDDDFSTTGSALVSENIELSDTGTDWALVESWLGTARLDVTGADGTDVFVGIAPVAEGQAYLEGVARTVVDDLGSGADNGRLVPGGEPATPPADQDFWVAQSSGTGAQQLTWDPTEGDWLLVVMNTDGSAGVSVEAGIGATVPGLTGLAWGVLIGGVVLLLISALLFVLAFRRGRRPLPPTGSWGPAPTGPPPAWSPPPPVDRHTARDATAAPPVTPGAVNPDRPA